MIGEFTDKFLVTFTIAHVGGVEGELHLRQLPSTPSTRRRRDRVGGVAGATTTD
jgi:hypothetical protein